MSERSRDSAVARIKKLLEHARGEGHHSEEEVNSALRLARKLMNEFNVEEAELFTGEDRLKSAYDQMKEAHAHDRAGKLETDDAYLAFAVDNVCDTGHVTRQKYEPNQGRDGKAEWRQHLYFYGMPRDVAVATALYHELYATVRAMARMACGPKWGIAHNSYRAGFVSRLVQRSGGEKLMPGPAGAIILSKAALLRRWETEKYGWHIPIPEGDGKKRKARSTRGRTMDWDAYAKGSDDANRVSLRPENEVPGPRPAGEME